MVGASREMVSRVMKNLTTRGEIASVDGRIMLRGGNPLKPSRAMAGLR
jgi:hypothetical protein